MNKLSEFITRKSKLVIIIVFILTIILGFFATKIKINSDVVSYLSKKEPVVKLFRKCGRIFGSNYLMMIAFENNNGIFNYKTLQRIKFISDEISEFNGVANVTSLTKIIDIKDIDGGIEVSDLITDEIPRGRNLLKLKKYVLSRDMYRGSIISDDAKSTVIMVKINDDVNRIDVARKVKKFIEKNKNGLKVYYTGMPVWIISMNDIILSDLFKLTPFVIIIVTLILFISFKSLRSVFLILITVFISAVWTIGIMSILGVDMTMISDIIPIILIAVGSAYGIHFINKYLEEKQSLNKNKSLLIKSTIKEVGVPIILAGLTTIGGFLSFLSANLTMIREFGIFTGLGVFFALLLSITFIPAIILNTKIYTNEKNISSKMEDISIIHKYTNKIGTQILKREKFIIISLIILLVLSVLMIFKITREVNMEKYFPENTVVRKASKYVKSRFGGSIPVQIYIEAENIKTPYILNQILYTEKFLNSLNDIHNSRAISDLLCELNKIMTGYYTIPDTEEKIGNLWFFIDGKESLEQMINDDSDKALIQATTTSMDTIDMKRHKKLISNFIKKELLPVHIKVDISLYPHKFKPLINIKIKKVSKMIYYDLYRKVKLQKIEQILSNEYFKNSNTEYLFNKIKTIIPKTLNTKKSEKLIKGDLYNLNQKYLYITETKAKKLGITGERYKLSAWQTGMGPIYINLDENLLTSQIQSIIIAFLIVFLLISFQFKSYSAGLISSIPILFSILMNFGLMGILHIPLDIATLMLGGITIGIGIDYTIHFVSRFKNELINNNSIRDSLLATLRTTGSSIIINALSVGLGFLILIFSNIIPLRHFGLLTFLIMIISSISAITILPAVFTITRGKLITKKN